LARANTLEQAREVLKRFLKDYNKRFCRLPKQAAAVFRKAPPKAVLHNILCLKETRMVKKDHTVSFDGLVLQIPFCKKYPASPIVRSMSGNIAMGILRSAIGALSSPASVRRL